MPRIPNRFGGGARTNLDGLLFEQNTSLNDAFLDAGFDIYNHYDIYYHDHFVGRSINQDKFSTIFLRKHGINDKLINSKRWKPDEAFINENNRTVYIIEKNFKAKAVL